VDDVADSSHRIVRLINPRALAAGAVMAFLGCALAGRIASGHSPYSAFVRIHPLAGPDSLVYPTASQLRAMVESSVAPNQVAVIVGGTSVFHGFSQGTDRLWTRRLQERLGPAYRVVNLALRGGVATEGGAVVAESLIKAGRPVILVADLPPGTAYSPLGVRYGYLFWDAYYKGLLFDDGTRERRLEELIARESAANRRLVAERRLGARMDSLFRFDDLWTWLAYRRFFTIWHSFARDAPFRSRDRSPDLDAEAPPLAQRYPRASEEAVMPFFHAFLDERLHGRTSLDAGDPRWAEMRRDLEASLPPPVRRRTLMVVLRNSPYYLDQLSGAERVGYDVLVGQSMALLAETGYDAVAMGGEFTVEDFSDAAHLAPAGGDKLAALLEPRIRGLAARLGDLP
jgi:hypothetical protein